MGGRKMCVKQNLGNPLPFLLSSVVAEIKKLVAENPSSAGTMGIFHTIADPTLICS